jgi:hypothetical protein
MMSLKPPKTVQIMNLKHPVPMNINRLRCNKHFSQLKRFPPLHIRPSYQDQEDHSHRVNYQRQDCRYHQKHSGHNCQHSWAWINPYLQLLSFLSPNSRVRTLATGSTSSSVLAQATTVGPTDNILQLNLTTEQLTFGETIGEIPNRGLNINNQSDVTLGGFPYLQTIQDVTNKATGKGDRITPNGIHFEPGMWLNVPATDNPKNGASVVRMASIPHGTTINAQSLVPPQQATALGGNAGAPKFDVIDVTPFPIGTNQGLNPNPFANSMDASSTNSPRIPQTLTKFVQAGTITTDIIKNPNLVLQNAIKGQDIRENISFEVATGSPTETINGGGTANISFLAGTQDPSTTSLPPTAPNAQAAFMKARFWVETVAYDVVVPRFTTRDTVLLKPTMPQNSTAPTPVFAVTPPSKLPSQPKTIKIPGIQIQYSQTVFLNFATLTWPHVSVATLCPKNPQPFTMTS